MKILIDITHPAHVHFFKHAINIWKTNRHQVLITSRNKDLTKYLLDRYGFYHTDLSQARKGLFGLGVEMIKRDFGLWKLIKKERPAVLTGIGGTFIAPIGKLSNTPVVIFTDTEHAKISNAIAFPFANAICTPKCYEGRIRRNQITYAGYHELAYLHPALFSPDPSKLQLFGVSSKDTYIVMRLVAWTSGHDMGDSGFTDLKAAVNALLPHGRILISSENPLPDDLTCYEIKGHQEEMHHLLAFATLYIGESATMASECAILGVPSIFISTSTRGYTNEQERKYGLTYTFSEPQTAQIKGIRKATHLLQKPNLKAEWQTKRDNMLMDMIDITDFITSTVQKYAKHSLLTDR